ncbi:MAG: Sulfite exporter TauE/SafE [Syntrophorhabdaceae bacterium PtaU1.Bin034]|nr:MAG: Sulfite exporter TauE/SafE [Syntrophorhabdaceae bacterium PtaU1.Bin034]
MSFLGASLLVWLSGTEPAFSYSAFGHLVSVTPVKLAIGLLLLAFALLELLPQGRSLTFAPRFMPLGGALSGFFGGLSGMQGALRSAFLSRAGISKEVFIGTSVVVALLIDFSRLAIYAALVTRQLATFNYGLLVAAVLAAFLGAYWGNSHLKKITMPGIQRIVATMLFVVALGLISGVL